MAKLFIEHITILDCAFWEIDHKQSSSFMAGKPKGKSWIVNCVLEGEADSNGILFDFGHAKKQVKKIIDEFFDHRFLCPEGLIQTSQNYATFDTQNFYLRAPTQNFCVLKNSVFTEENFYQNVEKEIEKKILEHCPENITHVAICLEDEKFSAEFPECEYTHSLKFHTGNCQRFHGHSNGVRVLENHKIAIVETLKAANFIHGKYFVDLNYKLEGKKNPSQKFCLEKYEHIFYESSQGFFELLLPSEKVVYFNSESTIENIAQFIHKNLNLPVTLSVMAFEGAYKGSVFP
jgi:6-pyruvoyl-tetrahydropterin synthase